MNPLFDFLNRLAANTDRPWFQAHKAEFDGLRDRWFADIDRLIAACSAWEPQYTYLSGKDSTFRIYRDTRFSPDKTPYKTFFSAALTPRGKSAPMAGFYISAGVNPDQCGIFGGMWCPDRDQLRKMRHAIVDNIEEFSAIVEGIDATGLYGDWCGDKLKTIPKGWERDHPQAPYLRLLHYGREHAVTPDFFADPAWPERAAEIMRPLKPLNDFINYSLFEE